MQRDPWFCHRVAGSVNATPELYDILIHLPERSHDDTSQLNHAYSKCKECRQNNQTEYENRDDHENQRDIRPGARCTKSGSHQRDDDYGDEEESDDEWNVYLIPHLSAGDGCS